MSSNELQKEMLEDVIISANTGADAIKRAPIVEEDTGIRCLRIGDVSNEKPYKEWGFTRAESSVINKFLLKKDDIMIARTGNTIGVVKYIDRDVNSLYNNGLIRLRVNTNTHFPKYIFYNLASKRFKDFVYSISGGTSTQPNMKIGHVLKYEVTNFSISEQKSISNLLSSLDEKIETNNQINKKLEEMAQAIFKHWFIDFEFPNENGEPYKSSGGEMVESELGLIPRGWQVLALEDVAKINPTEKLKKGQNSIYVEMANLPTHSARIVNYTQKEYKGGTKFRNGDILFARITPCLENGKTGIVDFLQENEIAFGSTEYIILRPKVLNSYYLYFLARYEEFRSNAIKNMNGTSGRQRVDALFIKQYKIVCPTLETLQDFSVICKPIFQKMKYNDEVSKVLASTRDTLLPKLMSGEIRVPLEN